MGQPGSLTSHFHGTFFVYFTPAAHIDTGPQQLLWKLDTQVFLAPQFS